MDTSLHVAVTALTWFGLYFVVSVPLWATAIRIGMWRMDRRDKALTAEIRTLLTSAYAARVVAEARR